MSVTMMPLTEYFTVTTPGQTRVSTICSVNNEFADSRVRKLRFGILEELLRLLGELKDNGLLAARNLDETDELKFEYTWSEGVFIGVFIEISVTLPSLTTPGDIESRLRGSALLTGMAMRLSRAAKAIAAHEDASS